MMETYRTIKNCVTTWEVVIFIKLNASRRENEGEDYFMY